MMEPNLVERANELKRKSNVTSIEAECITLGVGESKQFKIMDIQTYQRLRIRLLRLKDNTGRAYTTTMNGNYVIVTRQEDEEVL